MQLSPAAFAEIKAMSVKFFELEQRIREAKDKVYLRSEATPEELQAFRRKFFGPKVEKLEVDVDTASEEDSESKGLTSPVEIVQDLERDLSVDGYESNPNKFWTQLRPFESICGSPLS
jgi:hypothetical protein